MSHIIHDELNQQLVQASQVVKIGSIYHHYKFPDRDYRVLNLAIQEATEKICVIYQDTKEPNAPIFVRNLDSWLENVEWKGRTVARFVLA